MEIAIVSLFITVIFITQSVKVVFQQHAWEVERLEKYKGTLTPGLNFLMPVIEKVDHKHLFKVVRWTSPVKSESSKTQTVAG